MTLPPAAPSETDWLAARVADAADGPALVLDDGSVVSYGEIDVAVEEAAAEIAASRGGRGARLVFPAGRDLATIARLWACWRHGVVPVPVDPTTPPAARSLLEERWSAVATDAEPGAPGSSWPEVHTWVPTSGSTGSLRPVVLTHRNVAAAVAGSHARVGNTHRDRWLLVLPLHHVGGLSILWRSAAAGGAVVVHPTFDARAAAEAMVCGDVTVASVVPTMLSRILDAHAGPYRGMRAVLLGGAPAPSRLVERALDAGLPVLTTYGLTETCSQVATVVPGDERASIGTVGRVLDGFSVTIESGGVAVSNEVGEIVVAGDAVSPGYGLEPPRRGPLRTGDLGRFDGAGRLIVVGRSDDVILSGGEKVAPALVEAALRTHPHVAEAVVLGMADPDWGEVVTAFVVPEAGLDRAAVEDHLWRRLNRHEIPRRWVLIDELPLLPNGKIDRAALAAELSRG